MIAVERAVLYDSADDALRFAFRIEGVDGSRAIDIGPAIKGTNPSDLSFHERIAEGSFLRSRAFASVGPNGSAILRAWYGTERDAYLIAQRRGAVTRLAQFLCAETRRDPELLEEAVRDWAAIPMEHTYQWWAARLGVAERTVRRWCTSRGAEDRSAKTLLDNWRTTAMARVEDAFVDAKILRG